MQQRERLFHTQQMRKPVDVLSDEDIHQELVNKNQKHPESQDQIRGGLVLLTYQQELDEYGNTYARNKEHSHCCRTHLSRFAISVMSRNPVPFHLDLGKCEVNIEQSQAP